MNQRYVTSRVSVAPQGPTANPNSWEFNLTAAQFLVQFLTLILVAVLTIRALVAGLAAGMAAPAQNTSASSADPPLLNS